MVLRLITTDIRVFYVTKYLVSREMTCSTWFAIEYADKNWVIGNKVKEEFKYKNDFVIYIGNGEIFRRKN